jgi:hypothetical protein
MIVTFKYFYEETEINYDEYNQLWDKNIERIIFLDTDFPLSKQMNIIVDDITDNKDILAIRFPTNKTIKENKIINNIISGKGIIYADNKIWYPKEVWIYNIIT